jgi:hypothetical protein
MTRQQAWLLAAEIASMTETHSQFSGDFLYDLVVEESQPLSGSYRPRAMPVDLYIRILANQSSHFSNLGMAGTKSSCL